LNGRNHASAATVPWVDQTITVRSPAFPEDTFADDSTMGMMAVLEYRQYYEATLSPRNVTDNPNANSSKTLTVTKSQFIETVNTGTAGVSTTVNAELEARLPEVGASIGFSNTTSASFSLQERNSETSTQEFDHEVAECTAVGVYETTLVTEVKYYWEYWHDTLNGDFPPGFTTEGGFAVATSELAIGTMEAVSGNSIVRPVYWNGTLLHYEQIRGPVGYASPHL